MRFSGRVALATGGAMGIEREIALSFAKEGGTAILYNISEEVCRVAKEAEGLSARTLACRSDVGNRNEVEERVSKALQLFEKIDTLVNNAGMHPTKPFIEMSKEE
uniref:SDR family NAD(P)-dependent oxidoreductase n=1 Tax=Ignisphaera aggregans TaxID=334771 RepID=A0A7C4BCK8_9CREN